MPVQRALGAGGLVAPVPGAALRVRGAPRELLITLIVLLAAAIGAHPLINAAPHPAWPRDASSPK